MEGNEIIHLYAFLRRGESEHRTGVKALNRII